MRPPSPARAGELKLIWKPSEVTGLLTGSTGLPTGLTGVSNLSAVTDLAGLTRLGALVNATL